MEKKKFNIIIKNVDLTGFYEFYNLKTIYDIDSLKKPSVEVEFELDPIFTNQGLAEIEVKILTIKGNFNLYIDIDELDDNEVNEIKQTISKKDTTSKINQERIEFEYKLDVKEVDKSWDINLSNLKFDEYGGFEIDYAEIDIATKTIELS